jgi:hypothetical protein
MGNGGIAGRSGGGDDEEEAMGWGWWWVQIFWFAAGRGGRARRLSQFFPPLPPPPLHLRLAAATRKERGQWWDVARPGRGGRGGGPHPRRSTCLRPPVKLTRMSGCQWAPPISGPIAQ